MKHSAGRQLIPVIRTFQSAVFFMLLSVLLPTKISAAEPNRRFALVIGNSDYQHVEKLLKPANDATDIAEKLRGLDFQVELVLNAGNAEMGRAIAEYTRRLSANSANEGFFWYAGHGVQINGENYLLPVDIDAEDDVSLIYGSFPLNRLILSLEQNARNKLNVVILDACRDNPFRNMAGGTRGLSRGLMTVEHPPQDLFIMFSTAPGTVAADGERDKRNSPFTEAFLKYMENPEILPVVASLVTRETMRLTDGKQRPFQNGSLVSEIYYSLNPRTNRAASAGSGAASSAPSPGTPAGADGLNSLTPAARAGQQAPIPENFVRISGGTFTMGSPDTETRRESDEKAHRVRISPFYMGKYEVTQREYREIMGNNPSGFPGDDLPVEQVNWFDAVQYCNARSRREGLSPAYVINGETVTWNKAAKGYRLPTEAEWEYAARAGTAASFSTGEQITTDQANYNGRQVVNYNNIPRGIFRQATTAVGTFAPNAFGLCDMHGNVAEWCWDWLGDYAATSGETADPSGPAAGRSRVLRGGSWYSLPWNLRSAVRQSSSPGGKKNNEIGFRVVRPVE